VRKLLYIGILLGLLTNLGIIVQAKPLVVATNAIFGEFAEIIGEDLIEVFTITPMGFCPAHYDLRPSDIAAVTDAVLVIYQGFEPWMETLLASVGNSQHPVQTIQLTGEWNRPSYASEKCEAIAEALSETLPESTATFEKNVAAYRDKLTALAEVLQEKAGRLGVGNVSVISMQWQSFFVSWLGFEVVATYGMPENLSLKDLVELKKIGEENEVVLVIDNLQSGVDFGEKLAGEIGAIQVVLTNFPGTSPEIDSYLAMLKTNAETLFAAIEPLP